MEIFIEEAKNENNYQHLSPDLQQSWKSINHEKSWFRQCLAQVKSPEHPNLQYFIYKNIILRNLYGVDIMTEAVEIAKLRLFLKLVATVEADYRKPNLGLEPLPDIDFNIRAGNTLIGYATKNEIDDLQGMFVTEEMKIQILEECDVVSRAFQRFKELQLKGYSDKQEFTNAKTELLTRLEELSSQLDTILYKQHYESMDYEKWLDTHQPFHWFAEFYEIVQGNGGFDVIIGNPPYVEYSKVRDNYRINNYLTEKCGNLYAFVIERSNQLLKIFGKIGFIIPLSSVSTPRMEKLLEFYIKNKFLIYSSFYAGDSNPSLLFTGVKSQLSIQIISKSNEDKIFTTNYIRWFDEYRPHLFENIHYLFKKMNNEVLYKIGNKIESIIIDKIKKHKNIVARLFLKTSKNVLYYRNASGSYYRLFITEQPKLFIDGKLTTSSTLKTLYPQIDKHILHSLFSSSLFHWYWVVISDNYHITKKEFINFYFDSDSITDKTKTALERLSKSLMLDYDSNSKYRFETDNRNNAKRKVQIFEPRKSKHIIDEIDTILAQHYGFTDEELDFIINYDIKYRMGKELDEEEEV
jgi:methylase of polypeptide subunit release factors